MPLLLFGLAFFLFVPGALAYNAIVVAPQEPYDLIAIDGDPYVERSYLGTLADYPEMYELTTDVTILFSAELRQRATKKTVPFVLILVRQNEDDGGVVEIARHIVPLSDWVSVREQPFGMTFLVSPRFEATLPPGTYRFEVSSPDNRGPYLLTIGEEPTEMGFLTTLRHVYATQQHFGFTIFHMLFSSYVYYTLGSILIGYGIYRTWLYRKNLHHA